ncbi:MAG TPA: SAM-dependent methyltransferase [Burkholderiaceae bacterium]|nr:SAM-dependent methyltransferase [Burkholderiaceae bacterium]
MSGTLFLLPCPIAAGSLGAALPAEVIAIARRLGHFLVEDAKTARALLKELAHPQPMRELSIVEIGHAPRGEDIEAWLAPVLAGRDVAIVSEAGCPGIADPGGTIVAGAHARGIRVRPLVGPSSILLALMAAGLDGQRFRFHGYLPIPADSRTTCLKALERESKSRTETQVFIETPYRSMALFDAVLASCAPSTRLAVAADLMGACEFVAMRTVQQWKAAGKPPLQRRPAVFCLLAA